MSWSEWRSGSGSNVECPADTKRKDATILGMADTLEVRIAHLEGAYEQIDKRLGTLEVRLAALETTVRSEGANLRAEMRQQFHWILGFQIVTLLSFIGTLLAVFLMQ